MFCVVVLWCVLCGLFCFKICANLVIGVLVALLLCGVCLRSDLFYVGCVDCVFMYCFLRHLLDAAVLFGVVFTLLFCCY